MSTPNAYPGNEATPSFEELEHSLLVYAEELALWHKTARIDSLATQRRRATTFFETGEIFERLVSATKLAKCQIVLTTGEQPVHSFSFNKGPYDFYFRDRGEVTPGSQITIDQTTHRNLDELDRPLPNEFYRGRKELYIGTLGREIPFSTVAKTLSEGGRLELTKLPEEGEENLPE